MLKKIVEGQVASCQKEGMVDVKVSPVSISYKADGLNGRLVTYAICIGILAVFVVFAIKASKG